MVIIKNNYMVLNGDTVNLIASATSIILGFGAVALSVYFFVESKKTENRVNQNLESIKSQTDTLQKLTGRWMDRLTRYATESHPVYDETLTTLVGVIKEIPTSWTAAQLPSQSGEIERLQKDTITAYIGLFYYSAVTNVVTQFNIPTPFDVTLEGHNLIKTLVDNSHSDFVIFKDILEKLEATKLQSNPLHNLYMITETHWKPSVKNFTDAYQEKAPAPTS